MKCRRSEELWSDHLEGTLPRPLVKDLDEHVESCAKCRDLFSVFREVVGELQKLPRPMPNAELVARIVASTPARRKMSWVDLAPASLPSWRAWVALGAAATIAILFLPLPKPLADVGQRVNQAGHQAYSFCVRVYRSTDRIKDELTVLRMSVGVAFEDRLDRLNERLKDLQKAQQKNEKSQPPSSDQGSRLMLSSQDSAKTSPLGRSSS